MSSVKRKLVPASADGNPLKKQSPATSTTEPTDASNATDATEPTEPPPSDIWSDVSREDVFELFAEFCPGDMVDAWAQCINDYHLGALAGPVDDADDASDSNDVSDADSNDAPKQHAPKQKPTFREEIYLFFSCLIVMSSAPMDSIDEYWDTSPMATIHPFTRFMSRNRFYQLYRIFTTWNRRSNLDEDTVTVFDYVEGWSDEIQLVSDAYWPADASKSRVLVDPNGRRGTRFKQVWTAADSGQFLKRVMLGTVNGPVEGDISARLRQNGDQQAILYVMLMEVALQKANMLQKQAWAKPQSANVFRRKVAGAIVEKFGQQVVLRHKGVTMTELPPGEPHRLVPLAKRSHCAFCSSMLRNTILRLPRLTEAPSERCLVNTCCQQCGVALCENSKRNCWDEWHNLSKPKPKRR